MPDTPSPRLPPLPDDAWGDRLAQVMASIDPVLNVHRALAHHPELLAAWVPMREHLTWGGSLAGRHREIVILRVAHRSGSEYEWHHHVGRGSLAGLGEDEIEAIGGRMTGNWSDEEAALLAATDELFDTRTVSDATWDALGRSFTTVQVLDMVMTVGMYVSLAMLIAATGVQIEQ